MIQIDLRELQPLLKNLSTLSADLLAEYDAEIEESARVYVGLAKNKLASQLSSNNNRKTGRLLNSINYAPAGKPLSYEVFVQTNYAAYNEWGTITYVNVPPDLVDIAIKYKGRGIKKTGGMRAKNFFYSQRALVIPDLINNLNAATERRLNK